MESRGRGLLVSLLLLVAASCVVLVVEAQARSKRDDLPRAFQSLVGGLGFGPAVDLSGCAFSFDPRLDGAYDMDRGPVPSWGCFCPQHAWSVFFYAPLEHGVQLRFSIEADELSP